MQTNANLKGSRQLTFLMIDKGSTGTAYATVGGMGVWPIYAFNSSTFPATGKYAVAAYDTYDATCTDTSVGFTSAGNVTVTAFDSSTSAITATFDATSSAGDHITGSFTTGYCQITASDAGSSKACQ